MFITDYGFYRRRFHRTLLLLFVSAIIACNKQDADPCNAGNTYDENDIESLLRASDMHPEDTDIMILIWNHYTESAEHSRLIEYTLPVYSNAADAGKVELQVKAGVFLGQSYGSMGQYDSMKFYFEQILDHAKERNMLFALMSIYNSTAVYYIYSEKNYNRALEYFQMALDLSEQLGSSVNYGLQLCNIASLYHFRNDPEGLKYSLKAYEIGIETDNTYLVLMGANTSASLYNFSNEYDKALSFIERSLAIVDSPDNNMQNHKVNTYCVYADILLSKGEYRKAEQYYRKVIYSQDEKESIPLISYLGYGNLLLKDGRYREAIDIFNDGMSHSMNDQNQILGPKFCLGLSNAYHMLNDDKKAFHYYKTYRDQADSIFNIEKEREFSQLLLQYEKNKHEQNIQEKELYIARQDKKIYIAISLIIVFVSLLGAALIVYLKKDKMYRHLVEKHQEFVKREKQYKQINVSKADKTERSDRKGLELFRQIEHTLKVDKSYRDKDISVAKLIETFGCSRSLVSRVINKYSGMSFNNYITSLRMEEAIQVLSDPENEIPLKVLCDQLGYNSLTSFYRAFQRETGVPPSKYREKVSQLNKKSSF